MDKGICIVSVAPIRHEKSDKSELVTELLFGESVNILEVDKNWTKIKMHYDGYEGWVDTKQIKYIANEDFLNRKINVLNKTFSYEKTKDGEMLLSFGSELENQTLPLKQNDNIRTSIISVAKEFLNVPYLWGGRSFFGIDCSAFIQLVFKIHNIKLPRDSYQQGLIGEKLSLFEEKIPGDLAFFENPEGKIIHVGIVLEDNKIIHSSGKVRIDVLDSSGIFKEEINSYTHKLSFIRKVI